MSSAREKLLSLIGEGAFKRWFEEATFSPEGVALPDKFRADWVAGHFETDLRLAFGFLRVINWQILIEY